MNASVACRHLVWLWLVASIDVLAQADGACFEPARSTATTATPEPPDAASGWSKGEVAQPELLPPGQAFQIAVRGNDANTLVVELTPARDYHPYRESIGFNVVAPADVSIGGVALPGEPKSDPTFAMMQVHHRPFEAGLTLQQAAGPAERIELRVGNEGCNCGPEPGSCWCIGVGLFRHAPRHSRSRSRWHPTSRTFCRS